MRTRFRPDRQLTVRMLITVFLLGLVYVAFVAALIVLIDSVFLIVVIAAGLLAAQYWFSDRIALLAMRAQLVAPEQGEPAPRHHRPALRHRRHAQTAGRRGRHRPA